MELTGICSTRSLYCSVLVELTVKVMPVSEKCTEDRLNTWVCLLGESGTMLDFLSNVRKLNMTPHHRASEFGSEESRSEYMCMSCSGVRGIF